MSAFALGSSDRLDRRGIEARVLEGLARTFWLALPLTFAVGSWMVLLQVLEGAHTSNEPSLVVQILRTLALALPAVLLATSAALAASNRLCSAARAGSRLRAAASSTLVGVATAAVFATWHPVHAWLFGDYVHYSGAELSPLAYLLRDGMLALAVALPLAVVLMHVARRRDRAERRRSRLARGLTAAGATLGLALAGLATVALGGTAAAGALGACPASAPLRHFDVQAIDVKITLNRFGDNDPFGKMYVLSSRVSAVRAQEASGKVSTGLRNDAIQPLVIRANEGDCVEIAYTNNASGGALGLHADGLSYDVASSGDQIGRNPSSAPVPGGSTTYHYYVPDDPTLEGAHLLRPGPGNRLAVAHGLFGSLVVEPKGSTWLGADGQPLASGWEAMISPPSPAKAFREYALLFHEIGDEQVEPSVGPYDKNGVPLPTIDKHTGAYRPGSKAINYRSEPFSNRLDRQPDGESQAYGSYMFGDPATPTPRAYLSDPTKFRIVHAGSEMFHVFHMHGGGIRWRFNPAADKTFDYQKTGLDKYPKTQLSPSTRLDSQATGPGESYNLEIEGGAGGVQQGAGEFLFHCHIATHYVAGMWAFWRVYDTNQPGFAALPGRAQLPSAVTSAGLIGRTMPDGTTLTAANLDAWIRPQLPTQGVSQSDQDASVWNWAVDNSNPAAPVYLGEPEDTSVWPDHNNLVPGHPSAYPGDVFRTLPGETVARPVIQFDPRNGRISFPLMRTHVGKRPPFSPNGHSGAPWLGETGDVAPSGTGPSPFAGRTDGICPTGAPVRHFNVVALDGLRLQVTRAGAIDPNGKIFVLAHDVDDILAGRKPIQPLAIRANIGDCVAVTLTSLQHDKNDFSGFSKVNIHIHHVQFDTQASDGVVTGMSYEQTIRPFQAEDPQITQDAVAGATTLSLASVTKFQPGEWIAAGLATESIEVRQIASIDAGAKTITLTKPLDSAHAAGQYAGVEFVQYRWYPDVQLDNIFWHTHVDGIHDWGHGLVGQLIIEPKGSTYHDPQTGAEVDSGTIVDIHTTPDASDPRTELAPGLVDGSFREMALWEIDQNPVVDSTLNLRAEPWADRLAQNGDSSLLFSSYAHGDPFTPLPLAYAGDPFVIRTINVSDGVDTLHVDGHRFWLENRYQEAASPGGSAARPLDTIHYGISEKFSLIAKGGAGGPLAVPGDYLYLNGIGRRFRQGAWGIIRVLPGLTANLKPLPDRAAPASSYTLPAVTGGRPPEPADPGNPCPALAPQRSYDISAVDVPSSAFGNQLRAAFVPANIAVQVEKKRIAPEPLVLHVAAGQCITVHFTNRRTVRASFHSGLLSASANGNTAYGSASSGIDVGFGPEQSVAPGGSRDYRLYADTAKLGATLLSDFGGPTVVAGAGGVPTNVDTGPIGMYGAIVVAPAGATFTEPRLGSQVSYGAQVDVHVPGAGSYRDFTVLMEDNDQDIGQSHMPYPTDVKDITPINYSSGPRTTGTGDANGAFAATGSGPNGTPATPILKAYVGDPVEVHALVTPGSEQMHVFSLGGESWPLDPFLTGSNQIQARGIGPWETLQADVRGGAGGGATVGDLFYGDLRRPFTDAGLWGIQRVLSDASCPIRPLDGRGCIGGAPTFITLDAVLPATLITHTIPAVSSPTIAAAGKQVRRPVKRAALLLARGGHAIPVAAAPATCKRSFRLAGRGRACKSVAVANIRPLPAPKGGARPAPAAAPRR